MIRNLLKNAVLTFLVATSIVLSILLYNGGWGAYTEVGISDARAMQIASYPITKEATAPYQIALHMPDATVLLTPTTHFYSVLLNSLNAINMYDLHKFTGKVSTRNSIRFDFGSDLSHNELINFIPTLQTSESPSETRQVMLYGGEDSDKVYCLFSGDSGTYQGTTDISTSTFHSWMKLGSQLPKYGEWGVQSEQFIPVKPIKVQVSEWKVSSLSLLPLIHSFFVNPQAISKIQTGLQSAVWTDGNRAVRVDSEEGSLTFENPNTMMEPGSSQTNEALALAYIRDHGGSPESSLLYQVGPTAPGDNTMFALHDMYEGYPILSGIGTYEVSVSKERVVRLKRPTEWLSQETAKRDVTVIGLDQLTKSLHKVFPTSAIQSLDIQFGFAAVPTDNSKDKVVLKPVYTVIQQGIVEWTVDAVTGQLTQGMGAK